jgi:hypothetical protein
MVLYIKSIRKIIYFISDKNMSSLQSQCLAAGFQLPSNSVSQGLTTTQSLLQNPNAAQQMGLFQPQYIQPNATAASTPLLTTSSQQQSQSLCFPVTGGNVCVTSTPTNTSGLVTQGAIGNTLAGLSGQFGGPLGQIAAQTAGFNPAIGQALGASLGALGNQLFPLLPF